MTAPMLARVTVGVIVLSGNCIGSRSLWVSARTMAAVAAVRCTARPGLLFVTNGLAPRSRRCESDGLLVEPLREHGDVRAHLGAGDAHRQRHVGVRRRDERLRDGGRDVGRRAEVERARREDGLADVDGQRRLESGLHDRGRGVHGQTADDDARDADALRDDRRRRGGRRRRRRWVLARRGGGRLDGQEHGEQPRQDPGRDERDLSAAIHGLKVAGKDAGIVRDHRIHAERDEAGAEVGVVDRPDPHFGARGVGAPCTTAPETTL